MNESRQQLRNRLELLVDIRCWLLDRIDGSEETKGDDGLISDFIRKLDALSSEMGTIPASPAATPSLLVGQLDSLLKLFREAGWAEDCTLIVGLLNARGWAREAEREIADLCGQLAEWQKKAADVAVAWHGCIHRAEAAEAKLAEATKDAERYRWAKPVLSGDAECDAKTNQLAAGIMAGLDIDVIIDAALATKEST